MKINPHGLQPQLPISKSDEVTARPGQSAPVPAEATAESRDGGKTELKLLSLQYLVANLKNGIGVREDVVSRAQAKLQSGAYLSREGAVAAAKGVLGL